MVESNESALPGAGGKREVKMAIDERNMRTSYANMFRTQGTFDEVLLDCGLNLVNPTQGQEGQPDIVFQVGERVIMNYYTAKQLALNLGQLIRRHEEQFGVLELDVEKRRKHPQ